RMPLYIKPEKKLSVKDVFELMRDHFEGTELDISQDTGSGIYKSPYRPRPLYWEYKDSEYFNERPISTYQTGFSFVSQSRSNLPDETGGVLWFGVDDTFFTTYVPIYCSAREVPFEFSKEAGSISKFSWNSAFWVLNAVSNFVVPRYSYAYKDVKMLQSQLEGEFLSEQHIIEKKAFELYRKSSYDAIEFLTEYSKKLTTKMVSSYRLLFEELMVKYADGISKDEFFKPVNIGFPDDVKERIVKNDGSRYKVRKIPGQEKTDYELYKNKLIKLLHDAKIKDAEELLKKALKDFPKDEFFRKQQERLNKIKEELKKEVK
ncbi:MAG: C69 family dipeptidase, partial [Deltaproteobacteria bacterium]|nr:C69 family dipeptidase [Deltaproteobacteria bacterium]